MYWLLSILLIFIGLVLATKPRVWYELTERWKTDAAAEPSRVYLLRTRFGGVICIFVGTAWITVNLLGL